jgi:hypothetical protein
MAQHVADALLVGVEFEATLIFHELVIAFGGDVPPEMPASAISDRSCGRADFWCVDGAPSRRGVFGAMRLHWLPPNAAKAGRRRRENAQAVASRHLAHVAEAGQSCAP